MDAHSGVDRCKFGNYKGRVIYEGEYVTCDERPPVPDDRLLLKPSDLSFIYLRDGSVLFERSLCDARNKSLDVPR
jgi:hypothetical protein